MKTIEITPKPSNNNLYQPRFSDDERGGKVELRGDELRQLYRALRPALEG